MRELYHPCLRVSDSARRVVRGVCVNAAVGRCSYSRVIFPSMILFSVALCASILPLRVSGVPYCVVRYMLEVEVGL